MLSDNDLREMEGAAVELAREAGMLLMDYFSQPLTITYKSANHRNPVTDADHAADEFLRGELSRRYPDHGILTEESEAADDLRPEVVWVIDPLDGTTNFINGLPMFAVLIAALHRARPVVCAIFIPDINRSEGRVLHARTGGGAYDEDRALSLAEAEEPNRRMSAWPAFFPRMFGFRKQLRRRLGDVRSVGSAGYELALAGRGVFDYVVFNGLWSWDLAAGVLLVQEAGGAALQYDRKQHTWKPFEQFVADGQDRIPSPAEIGRWRGTIVLGKQAPVARITGGLRVPSYRLRRLRAKLGRMLWGSARRAGASGATGSGEAAAPQLHSQGQGRSRRE